MKHQRHPFKNSQEVECHVPSVLNSVQSASPASQPAFFKHPVDGSEMVSIPSGRFLMGSDEQDDEEPIHEVELSGFYMSKYPISVDQYREYCKAMNQAMPSAPDFNKDWSKGDHPIVRVSWKDATAYCEWLSQELGKPYSLPTEAEWEYACRGGRAGKYPWGHLFDVEKCASSVGWDSLSGTVPVGRYPANGYGLFDMVGNVWEWCSDWYDPDYYNHSPSEAPKGPAKGTMCVIRGGSWSSNNHLDFCCANRDGDFPDYRSSSIGFRVAFRGLP